MKQEDLNGKSNRWDDLVNRRVVADQTGSVDRIYPGLALFGARLYGRRDRRDRCGPHGKKDVRDGEPDSFVGNYEFQVPIFMLTHEPPLVAPKQDEHLTSRS